MVERKKIGGGGGETGAVSYSSRLYFSSFPLSESLEQAKTAKHSAPNYCRCRYRHAWAFLATITAILPISALLAIWSERSQTTLDSVHCACPSHHVCRNVNKKDKFRFFVGIPTCSKPNYRIWACPLGRAVTWIQSLRYQLLISRLPVSKFQVTRNASILSGKFSVHYSQWSIRLWI